MLSWIWAIAGPAIAAIIGGVASGAAGIAKAGVAATQAERAEAVGVKQTILGEQAEQRVDAQEAQTKRAAAGLATVTSSLSGVSGGGSLALTEEEIMGDIEAQASVSRSKAQEFTAQGELRIEQAKDQKTSAIFSGVLSGIETAVKLGLQAPEISASINMAQSQKAAEAVGYESFTNKEFQGLTAREYQLKLDYAGVNNESRDYVKYQGYFGNRKGPAAGIVDINTFWGAQ